ncbi:hypothetical protein [Aliikangiella coralliicola]|uniref:Uncharacterized protein n=1 Tax=Aliikangiella coralliicola TaxID=2592383 RepID=A0A545UAE9_9GAMM|nr:hypothetical protein [Aliikangiella coralliicola]TQV86446.1 hypothetical protein FLL46_16130 [Aliikangiella coralliicola]
MSFTWILSSDTKQKLAELSPSLSIPQLSSQSVFIAGIVKLCFRRYWLSKLVLRHRVVAYQNQGEY